jgi:hypothetical protein
MRASPPIDIELSRSRAWLAFVITVVLGVTAVMVCWLALVLREPGPLPMAAIGLAALTLGLIGSALGLARRIGGCLRWTGQRWELEDGAAGASLLRTGHVAVVIDLGRWLLLRFSPSAEEGGTARWLPVERRGHEGQWHALRCALYSSRPAPDSS